MKQRNQLTEWLKNHTKQAIAIIIAILLIVALAIAGATGAFNTNVDVNEHISDETKESTESVQESTESEPETTVKPDNTSDTGNTSTGTGDGSTSNGSGNNTGGNTGGIKPTEKEPVWVPDQGHYEKVWVENWVTVVVTPEKTEQVFDYMEYVFAYDGYTTASIDNAKAHSKELILAGAPSNYTQKEHYKTVTTPAVTKQEDQGYYEEKWVVDVPGHWE